MKCPICHSPMAYEKGDGKNEYYFVCPKCGRTIGKKESAEESDKKQGS